MQAWRLLEGKGATVCGVYIYIAYESLGRGEKCVDALSVVSCETMSGREAHHASVVHRAAVRSGNAAVRGRDGMPRQRTRDDGRRSGGGRQSVSSFDETMYVSEEDEYLYNTYAIYLFGHMLIMSSIENIHERVLTMICVCLCVHSRVPACLPTETRFSRSWTRTSVY